MKYRIVKVVDGNEKAEFFIEYMEVDFLGSLFFRSSRPTWKRCMLMYGTLQSFQTLDEAEYFINSMHRTQTVVKEIEIS